MRRWMKVLVGLVGLLVVGAGAFWMWAVSARDAYLGKTWKVPHEVDFPVPFPLAPEELAALRIQKLKERQQQDPTFLASAEAPADLLAGVDLTAVASERAAARGKHLIESRLGCFECHGTDLAGGTMIDAPPMGRLLGPNITPGGVTKGWGPADWDRIVRHGIMHDGHTAIMPADDFAQLSDRELSDVIAYARSVPASDEVIPAPQYGPVLTILLATGQVPAAPYLIDHDKVPPKVPPAEAADPTYGKHLANSCQGCHGHNFSGGPIRGGDPSWPPAANLTPTNLEDWSYEDFEVAVRKGRKKAGGEVQPPMPWQAYAKMSDVEIQALWAFMKTLPPTGTGVR